MSKREQIINTANGMLHSIGPTSMTMDMVARACGISKRTLYEEFPDKRTLIAECIDMETTLRDCKFKRIFDESADSFDALFRIFTLIKTELRATSRAYYDDLRRLYPDAMQRHRHSEKEASHMMSMVLSRAQKEGLVISGINPDISAFLLITLISSLHRQPERIAEYGFNESDVAAAVFLSFLRSGATAEGIRRIDNFVTQAVQPATNQR